MKEQNSFVLYFITEGSKEGNNLMTHLTHFYEQLTVRLCRYLTSWAMDIICSWLGGTEGTRDDTDEAERSPIDSLSLFFSLSSPQACSLDLGTEDWG